MFALKNTALTVLKVLWLLCWILFTPAAFGTIGCILAYEALVWGRERRLRGVDPTNLWGERWAQGLRFWSAIRSWSGILEHIWLSKSGPNVGDQLARTASELVSHGAHIHTAVPFSEPDESQFVSFMKLALVAQIIVHILGCGVVLALGFLPVYLILGCLLRLCGFSVAIGLGTVVFSGTLLYHVKCLIARILGFGAKQETTAGGGP